MKSIHRLFAELFVGAFLFGLLSATLVAMLLLSGCGGGDASDDDDEAAAPPRPVVCQADPKACI